MAAMIAYSRPQRQPAHTPSPRYIFQFIRRDGLKNINCLKLTISSVIKHHDAVEFEKRAHLYTDSAWVCEFVDMLHVTFVGIKHNWGRLKSSWELSNSVSVRALKVVKWIVSLSLFHTSYHRMHRTPI